VIVAASLDRIPHHSTTINIREESYRIGARSKGGVVKVPTIERGATEKCVRI
jgi:hypothetical protein